MTKVVNKQLNVPDKGTFFISKNLFTLNIYFDIINYNDCVGVHVYG